MDDGAFLHEASNSVRFWVMVDGQEVAASVSVHALHYHFTPSAHAEDALQTYQAHASEIEAVVRRQLALGCLAPVILREHHLKTLV